jgi:polyisoprenoid-binding protein YceI
MSTGVRLTSLDAEHYPEITFESTKIEQVDETVYHRHRRPDPARHRQADHAARRAGGTEIDLWGKARVGIEATGALNRSDYEMSSTKHSAAAT